MRKFLNRYTPVHERVLQRTKIPTDKSKCWVWTGPVNNAGYGLIKGDTREGDPKMVTVHRVMARHKGLQIKRKEVQHVCLNKACVNPEHLVLGTPQTRYDRLAKKYGKNFQKPKNPYVVCDFCNESTHVVWFSRMHKDCNEFTCKKVK